jgi:hypothetical protein
MLNDLNPYSVRAELVEAPFFTLQPPEKKERSFDKLRTNGSWE